ncbi:PEP-CTERM sorting domain-containing protein [Thalassotalea ponticola]|uniref:PEP-CTERM sorting domain-containing protein n=1 Tax=Thalassotalea ponticola TaxID=1523392 RepID=UPI0025B40EA1|nr:PEP-CTERM sorting domain-containing protein [Thalassotalea ponticola]MDN3651683.1 PEP-CTERM sorting domain-containing protein [Thalassotalea ponticola]
MKKYLTAILASIGLMMSASAYSEAVDFVALEETEGEGGTDVLVVTTSEWTVTITASGGFAYLDGPSGGEVGGLGACQNLDANDQCDPRSDDNVTLGESLTFTFSGIADRSAAILAQLWFNNNHDGGFGEGNNNVEISFDSVVADYETLIVDMNSGDQEGIPEAYGDTFAVSFQGIALVNGDSFTVSHINGNSDFYMAAMATFQGPDPRIGILVPEPTNIMLLALGLMGIVVSRRKRTL